MQETQVVSNPLAINPTPAAGTQPWADLLQRIGQSMIGLTGAEAVWICIVDNDREAIISGGIAPRPNPECPGARVSMMDEVWSLNPSWVSPELGLIWQAFGDRQARFAPESIPADWELDGGLADAFFLSLRLPLAAVLPLLLNEQTFGVIALAGPADFFAGQPRRQAALAAAEQAAVSIQQVQLLQGWMRQARELETLNRISRTITSSLDPEEVIRRTMAGINEILDVEAGSLLLLDEEADELYFKITLRGENKSVSSFRLKMGQGIVGWAALYNQPALVLDVHSDPRFFPHIDEAIGFHTHSVLCVPLVIRGQPKGAVEVINKRHGNFTLSDQKLLTSMTASLAIAIENATLFEESQARIRRVSVINDIAATLNAELRPEEVVRTVAKQINRLLPYESSSLILVDDVTQKLSVYFLDASGGIRIQDGFEMPLADAAITQGLRQGQVIMVPDLNARPEYRVAGLWGEDISCVMTAPMIARGKVLGTLNLGNRRPNFYDNEDLETLKEIAAQVAVAMENSRLFALMEQRTSDLQLLNRTGEMLFSTMSMERIIQTALGILPRLVIGDIHALLLIDGQETWLGMETPYQADVQFLEATSSRVREIYKGFSEREVEVTNRDIRFRGELSLPQDWKIRSYLTMPILTLVGPTGVAYVGSLRPTAFDDAALRVFSLIVSQISAAVENTRLFHEVESEQAKQAAILGSTAEVILVIDRKGRVLLANPSAQQTFGFKKEETGEEQLLSEVIHNQHVLRLFDKASGEETVTGEIPLEDGRTLNASVAPVGSGQNLIGWVAVMQDMTHFKELDQMKSDFVSTVSHDLRSPLAVMLLAAGMVKRFGPVTQKQEEFLEVITKNVKDMSQLIDELLDVGKIESGIDMDREPCSLPPILEEVTDSFEEQTRDKKLELALHLPPCLGMVLGNEHRLKQVVSNLIGNAIKYTPAGKSITVQAEDSGSEVVVSVRDTGIGIPPADQPYVFDKFYRVGSGPASEIKGSGLGLAIVKSIVEKYDGRVWLESEVGTGSTFYFALPRAEA